MGIVPNAQFRAAENSLTPGDFLLFCIDGIIDVEPSDAQSVIEGLRESVSIVRRKAFPENGGLLSYKMQKRQ